MDFLDKLFAHANEVKKTLGQGVVGERLRHDRNILRNKIVRNFPILGEDPSTEDMINSVGFGGITKVKGLDPLRHTSESFNRLGDKVSDPLAEATHHARGNNAYLSQGIDGASIGKQELTQLYQDMVKEEHKLSRLKEQPEAHSPEISDTMDRIGELSEEISDIELGDSVMRDYMKGSKMKLDRPLYVTREEGAYSGTKSGYNHIVSAQVIDPENIKGYDMPYTGDGFSDKVYKIPKNESIYHPKNLADHNEVVVGNEVIRKSKSMDRETYIDMIKKGFAPFLLGGMAIGDLRDIGDE